ncbi:hypothetical protein SYJ56_02535 [Algoriphagus sp. D3-2-R+10]|uniref:hypothetical protein n=1 Tax=Algoriphagus aurantiacus TaxID=3103948 RepID=UPI002B3AF117|nr:hypothetical protein [Algoriphagus sp. D3-2-R+10]MEB2774163.1 hypothetical protein [Algoriphagus sp. D3-2-R+10]
MKKVQLQIAFYLREEKVGNTNSGLQIPNSENSWKNQIASSSELPLVVLFPRKDVHTKGDCNPKAFGTRTAGSFGILIYPLINSQTILNSSKHISDNLIYS